MVGDVLLSSGLGGRFPNGYPVAIVQEVEVIEDEAFVRISAKPIAKLDRSNHVLLLSHEPNDDQTFSSAENASAQQTQ